MTPPTILWGLSCFELDSKSIGQRNWTHQVRTVLGVVVGLHNSTKLTKWLLPPCYDVDQVLGSIQNQLFKEIGHFKFERSSYCTWCGSRIAQFSCLDFTQNSPNDSSLIMILPKFWLDSKSVGQRNWTHQVHTKFVSYMEWLEYCRVLVIGFHSKVTKWLLPPYYDVAQVLAWIRTQLVEEIGHFKFIRSSYCKWSGWRVA